MKIGILSDTHENMPAIKKAVDLFNDNKVEAVFHAGDIISPITFKEFKNLRAKFYGVFGNNDGEKRHLQEKFSQIGQFADRFFETEIEGCSVLLMHEPDLLDALVASQEYDLIIYEHTHNVDTRVDGKTLVVNPGECGGWLTGRKTVALVDLPEKKHEIIDL